MLTTTIQPPIQVINLQVQVFRHLFGLHHGIYVDAYDLEGKGSGQRIKQTHTLILELE
jgi:hypothetical protein